MPYRALTTGLMLLGYHGVTGRPPRMAPWVRDLQKRGFGCGRGSYNQRRVVMTDTAERLFWCQEQADADDNPYMPEFLNPHDASTWKRIVVPGAYFWYVLYCDQIAIPPLYTGVTNNVYRRLTQHRASKQWWPLVDRIIVGLCDDETDARECESRFIARTHPLFNVVGNRHGD